MENLRHQALNVLAEPNPDSKASAALAIGISSCVDAEEILVAPARVPGRLDTPALVSHVKLKTRSVHSTQGRAALLHALAHIELNAINLATDIVWRFPGLPEAFYRDWMSVAKEEALHFTLLRDHLHSLGHAYGDFPAHNGLWDMAERTKDSLLGRLAIVPRTLEARGLDASPPIKAKLAAAGDHRGAEILDLILRDEIGHVAVGNRWYRWACARDGLDPITTYAALVTKYEAPRLRPPFNLEARRLAGFEPAELDALHE